MVDFQRLLKSQQLWDVISNSILWGWSNDKRESAWFCWHSIFRARHHLCFQRYQVLVSRIYCCTRKLPYGNLPVFPPSEEDIWECNAATMEECLNAFLDARIFDGKTFWEVESEIEWVDDWWHWNTYTVIQVDGISVRLTPRPTKETLGLLSVPDHGKVTVLMQGLRSERFSSEIQTEKDTGYQGSDGMKPSEHSDKEPQRMRRRRC